jgi:DNA-binding transcriptional regulator YiaG
MTSSQFNKALTILGLTQKALSDALEINERTVRNWVGGRSAVPTTIAALLHLMIDTKSGIEALRLK